MAQYRTDPNAADAQTKHPSQWLALVLGAAFTLAGLLGFLVTGFDQFAGRDTNETLLGLEINPLHNIVHLVLGLLGLAMWRRLATARTYGWLLFVGYAAAFVYGLFAVNNRDINFLSLNNPDNWFHLASSLAGLVTALLPARRRSPMPETYSTGTAYDNTAGPAQRARTSGNRGSRSTGR